MTEKYEYCITVPRTFDHDCRLIKFLNFLCFFKNQPRLKKFNLKSNLTGNIYKYSLSYKIMT